MVTYACKHCKKPFFYVVVLCSGNKKQTKKQERGIPLSSPSRVLECRVFIAGCCHRHSTFRSLCFRHWPRSPCNTMIMSEQVIGLGMGSWLDLWEKMIMYVLRHASCACNFTLHSGALAHLSICSSCCWQNGGLHICHHPFPA